MALALQRAVAADDDLPLQAQEIPTFVFGALTRLQQARCFILAFRQNDVAQCRAWLRQLADRLSYGLSSKTAPAHVLGLTAGGLRALGLAATDLDTFPAAFVNGMTAVPRARALGDTCARSPSLWNWGNDRAPADAAVLVYGSSAEDLGMAIAALPVSPAVRVICEVTLQERVPNYANEPFGFVDGISQPAIPGTPPAVFQPTDHQVKAGEFILGYRDNSGYVAPGPTVAARNDPGNILTPLTAAAHDLGRNSTFLVIRQLRQHVQAFNTWCKAAATPQMPPDTVKAKLVGRWQNATSLVRNPDAPGTGDPDNDFCFGRDDPLALACPRGAHIRRGNARDALHPTLPNALDISNRHRILRVGRPYVVPPATDPDGLLFMCLNAEIERQFEFLQQSWMLRRSFDGLRNESDALLGANMGAGKLTVQTGNAPVFLTGMPDFVTPIGGGYFWLPSRTAVKFLSA
ncbi:MAG TPA: hypothetical protein VKI44_06240 [Acetobacteraceae bacterium]|nr:hypothetical protein [Acetobacteraceae bacterium]